MSGHSKWSQIKRQKGSEDAKRAQTFTKLGRDVTIAARHGGGDPAGNPALRAAVEKAKALNMPKANIERAIARGTGTLEGVHVEHVTYEGYGPGGVGFLVECLTDNKNRTVAQLRNIFSQYGGSIGDPGSVAYAFTGMPPVPTFTIPLSGDVEIEKTIDLIDELEEMDDVLHVYHNAQID